MKKDKISLIVPCYNEEETLQIFYNEVLNVIQKMGEVEFELIFIDDGSSDNTLHIIQDLRAKDHSVRYLSFSRNFGKEAGLYAGLEAASGDYVGVLDADLQDPPQLLEEMYATLKAEEYDCVATRRQTREGESAIRSFFARMFYRLINKISDTDIVDGARDFRLMSRKMVDAILAMSEYNRFSKGIFSWVGFKTRWLSYDNVERIAGTTKWSFWGLFIYAVNGIIAFSTTPLVIASLIGILFCFIALIMIGFFIVKTVIFGDPVAGYPSLVCIIFMVSGVQLFCIGVIGQYLSKVYMETKKRPVYIVKTTEEDIKCDEYVERNM